MIKKKIDEKGIPEQPKIILPEGYKKEAKPAQAVPATEGNLAPIDKICQIISADDEKLLAKIQKEVDALRKAVKEREDFMNLVQRVQADFDNYQKRIRREKELLERYQDEYILKDLIPAFDNLDVAVTTKCTTDESQNILNGVELTRKEIMKVLDKRGVKIIKSLGEKFDPNFHEAIALVETADKPAGIVIEELKPGFMLHDRVLRPAKVKVSTPPKQQAT